VTERELDRTKNELVRALRRRAAEIDGDGPPAGMRTLTMSPTSVMTPMRPRKERVAFFARDTFRNAALTPVSTRIPD
jgi:hypothetical protein